MCASATRCCAQPASLTEVGDALAARFERREQSEAERIARVVALVTHDGCQVQALVAYFGETRAEPCGHCTFCLTGEAQRLPEPGEPAPLQLDERALDELAVEHPAALAHAAPARTIPLRPHEPCDDACQALPGPALRRLSPTSGSATCSDGARASP